MRVEEIPINKLKISELNIRASHEFGDEEDQEFIRNVGSQGILQPIVVRPSGDMYEIFIGRRRFLSLKQNGALTITCIVKNFDDEEALDASISENIFRKRVDPVTLGLWIKKRLEQSDMSLSEYARKIGKAKSTISEWMRMNDLTSELQFEVGKGSVPFLYALKVARLGLTPEQENMLARETREAGFGAFKKAVDRIAAEQEKRGAPKGLQVVRMNFGNDSQEYRMLKQLSENRSIGLSEYCMAVLEEHVRSSNA